MKNVLKIAILCLTLTVIFVLATCSGTETTAEATTAATTTEADKSLTIAANGASDYVIVYDDTSEVITDAVSSYITRMKSSFGITLTGQPISAVTTPFEKEIIVGDVGDKRSAVNTVKEKCKASDFAISIQGDDLVLYATDDQNYSYLFAALVGEPGLKPAVKGSLGYNQDFYYHDSTLKEMNYLQYKSRNIAAVNGALVQTAFTYHETAKANGQKLAYRLYVPSNYDPEKEYPLIVVLHGAGERGTDNEKQFANLILEIFKHKTSPIHNAIVLLPQCPTGNQWVDTPWANCTYNTTTVKESDELQTVMKVLTGLCETYSVDASRIYATGISMGGYGTWDLLMRHGDVFAAGIPICGAADTNKAAELAKIPIRTFHSADDKTVPPTGTREIAEAIKQQDPVDFLYTEFENGGHDAWTRVGKDLSVWEWLFSQTKAN